MGGFRHTIFDSRLDPLPQRSRLPGSMGIAHILLSRPVQKRGQSQRAEYREVRSTKHTVDLQTVSSVHPRSPKVHSRGNCISNIESYVCSSACSRVSAILDLWWDLFHPVCGSNASMSFQQVPVDGEIGHYYSCLSSERVFLVQLMRKFSPSHPALNFLGCC